MANGESINDRPGQNIQSRDPGELENRLSLNPSTPEWKEFLGNWSDGEEYIMTVKVRQVSPGEFEVVEATPQDSEASNEEVPAGSGDDSAGASSAETTGDDSGMNPAVSKMMAGTKY